MQNRLERIERRIDDLEEAIYGKKKKKSRSRSRSRSRERSPRKQKAQAQPPPMATRLTTKRKSDNSVYVFSSDLRPVTEDDPEGGEALPRYTNPERELRDIFSDYGTVVKVYPVWQDEKKWYCRIQMSSEAQMRTCITAAGKLRDTYNLCNCRAYFTDAEGNWIKK